MRARACLATGNVVSHAALRGRMRVALPVCVPEADTFALQDVMIRTPGRATTVTVGLLWLLNATDGRTVLCYEVNRNKVLGLRDDGGPLDGAYLGFGFRISHAQLAQHADQALAADTLMVRCRVTAATSLLTDDEPVAENGEAQTPPPHVSPPSLSADLAALLASGEGADVALVAADGTHMPAHRAILAARSPVLAARLRGSLSGAPLAWPGAEGDLPLLSLDDVAAPVLGSLLRYLYSEQSDVESGSVEEAQHLMVHADALGLPRLRALCEQRLAAALDAHTAAYTLVLADQHNAASLRAAAMAFVARNAADVLPTEGWAHLVLARPSLQTELIALLASQQPAGQQAERSGGGSGASGGRNVRPRRS